MLLEKPMAVTEEDCEEIAKACSDANVIVAVCHVLRYGLDHYNPEKVHFSKGSDIFFLGTFLRV